MSMGSDLTWVGRKPSCALEDCLMIFPSPLVLFLPSLFLLGRTFVYQAFEQHLSSVKKEERYFSKNLMADKDYNELDDLGYEDEPVEPKIEEGIEEDTDLKDNDDISEQPLETEDKVETEPIQHPHKIFKFMTKYERARILGTRAL